MALLRSVAGVAALVFFPACHSSSDGTAPSGLSAPLPGSVFGNWVVEAGSIHVVADTGRPHLVRGGNAMRIDLAGVEVLLDAFLREGGGYHARMVLSGATPVVTTSASRTDFDCTILVDYSAAQKNPPLTDYRITECSGAVRDGVLQVSYLARVVEGGQEAERDEVLFACRPGDTVSPDMNGTWEVTGFEVIADTGDVHGLAIGDLVVVSGGRVEQLFSSDYVAKIYHRVAVRPPNTPPPTFDTALRFETEALAGRVSGVIVQSGFGWVFPDRPPAIEVTFDFIRVGDEISGKFHLRWWSGSFLDPDDDFLAVTLRRRG